MTNPNPFSKSPGLTRRRDSAGYMLLTTALSVVGVMGMAGLAIDVGRMYVARDESQAYVDAVALNAALKLDGTSSGITNAQNTATTVAAVDKWNFGKNTFSSATMQFAKPLATNPSSPDASTWVANPANPAGYSYVRVAVGVDVPITFMQAINAGATKRVGASSVGGQVYITSYINGLLPFSPVTPNSAATTDWGFRKDGTLYTIRYPSQGGLTKGNVCAGDQNAPWLNSLPSQDRGYWGANSAAAIRGEIIDNTQVQPLTIGDPVPMVGGAKNTEGSALDARVLEDTDPNSDTWLAYTTSGTGNGRRIVGLPVNDGPNSNFTAMSIRAFFLQKSGVYSQVTGTDPICAEYIGAYIEGSGIRGGSTTLAGGFQVRIVQ